MASALLYHAGVKALLNGTAPFLTTTVKAMLVTPTYAPDVAHVYASSASTYELTGTGYAAGYGGSGRRTLASKTITVDATNERIVFDAADLSWTALTAGTSGAVILFVESGGADTSSPLLAYLPLPNFATDGTDYPVAWHDTMGCFYLSNPDPND